MRTILSSSDSQLTTGSPYWPQRNDTCQQYSELTEDLSCDVAVIGGGITGALIAYRMVRAGLETVLVDKGRFGSGSTSASTALISYEFDMMLTDLIERIGERSAIKAYKLCYEATSRIKELVHELEDPCDHEDKVAIRVTNQEADLESLKKETRLRNRHGLGVELLDQRDLESRYGIKAALGLSQIMQRRSTHLSWPIDSSVVLSAKACKHLNPPESLSSNLPTARSNSQPMATRFKQSTLSLQPDTNPRST